MPFEQFPYTNFHELNLDWIITEIKNNNLKIEDLEKIFTDELSDIIREQLQTLYADVVYDESNERIIMTVGGV